MNELILKKDALHAVLHNTGDAAVAAVQSIQPLAIVTEKQYNELLEEHLELIRRLPKAFTEPQSYRYCPYCGNRGIHLRCDDVEFNVRGIHVEYAYQNAKTEREESNERTID